MRIKIKIKNIFYFFIEGWNWKEKLIQPKYKKKKKQSKEWGSKFE